MIKPKKNMLGVAVPYPDFFGHTGTCTGIRTLTKVLESIRSDRQNDKSYSCFLMPNFFFQFSVITFFLSCIQRAYETLKQNLVKFKHSSHELRS